MALTRPVIYNLATDYARFGLTWAEAGRIMDNRFTNRFDPLSGVTGKPEFIVLHIQAGTTPGSLDWWANGAGVQASATALAQKDGSLLYHIPPQHGPWTNGDVNQPKPEAADLIAKPGNKNIWSLTIEAEGWPNQVMPQAQLNSIAWQCIQWMNEYDIPMGHIERHGAINSVDRPQCGLYLPQVLEIITAEIASPPPPTYTDPLPLPFSLTTSTGFHTLNGADVFLFQATVETLKDVVPRAWAESNAPRTGPNIPVRTKVKVYGEVKNDQKQQWFFLEDGSRVRASSFTPAINVRKR